VRRRIDPDNVAFYAEVGRRVAATRRRAGMSQQQLAGLLGIRQAAVSHYETGRRGMQLHTFADLCDALGADPAELLGPTPGDRP